MVSTCAHLQDALCTLRDASDRSGPDGQLAPELQHRVAARLAELRPHAVVEELAVGVGVCVGVGVWGGGCMGGGGGRGEVPKLP
jgi:hypothetical protein